MPARDTRHPVAGRLALAFAGAIWAVPFLSPRHLYPIPTFHGELAAGVLGLAALTVWLVGRGAGRVSLPASALLPLFLAGLIAVQLPLGHSVYPEDGIAAVLLLAWAAAVVWLAAELRGRYGLERLVVVLAWCALAGALASTAIGLFQHYFPQAIGRIAMQRLSPAIYANLGQPNHLAHQLGVGLASLIYLAATRRVSAARSVLMATPMVFVWALTQSRSPWLYALGFVTVAVLHRQPGERDGQRRLVVGSLLLLPGIATAQAAAQLPFLQSAGHTMMPVDRLFDLASGWSPRIAVWKEAWKMFAGAPLLGVGFGQFAWHHFLQVSVAAPAVAPGFYDHAHNLLVHLLAELGFFAGAAVLIAAFAWIGGVLREPASPERWWVLAIAAVIGIHSMLEYPLWYAYFLGAAALLAGLADRRRIQVPRAFPIRLVSAPILIAGWIACLSLYLDYARIEGLTVNSFTTGSSGDRVRDALKGVGGRSLLRPYADLGLAGAEPLNRERLAEKLERNSRVLRFAPTRDIAYRQVALLALGGQGEAAQAQLVRSATYYPGFLPAFARVLEELEGTDPAVIGPLLRYSEERLHESGNHAVRPN